MTLTGFFHLPKRCGSCQRHRARDCGAVLVGRLCVFIGSSFEALEKRVVVRTFAWWRKRDGGVAVRIFPGAPRDVRVMFRIDIDFLFRRRAELPNTWLLSELDTAKRSLRFHGTGTGMWVRTQNAARHGHCGGRALLATERRDCTWRGLPKYWLFRFGLRPPCLQ